MENPAILSGAADIPDNRGMARSMICKRSPLKRQRPERIGPLYRILAERTGLEPATPGVTGRYSNRLNYRSRLGRTTRRTSGNTNDGGC